MASDMPARLEPDATESAVLATATTAESIELTKAEATAVEFYELTSASVDAMQKSDVPPGLGMGGIADTMAAIKNGRNTECFILN
jgi:hypothetical protein